MTATATHWRQLQLDPATAPHRRVLVEASAGTGKTWTISVLYLRLVVEHGLRPESILVSTFTDAAAAELRERIRARLQWAWRHFDGPADIGSAESELRDWLAALEAQVPAAEARWRVQRALAELDRAPIATLHALCRRILSEQVLASGSDFRPGELVSARELESELLDDLARLLAHGPLGDEASGLPALHRMSAPARAKLVKAALQPGIEIVGGEVDALLAAFAASDCPARIEAFAASIIVDGKKYALGERLRELAAWLRTGDAFATFDEKKLKTLIDPSFWHAQVRAEHVADTLANPVAIRARAVAALLLARDAILQAHGLRGMLPTLLEWRTKRLTQRRQFTFDDLIERVHAQTCAARDQDDDALADRLHAQWPVALIDEFQDTDARQWEIFDAIHRDAAGAARGLLLLIGDPKQSIYRFRGSDIASYLRAAATTTQRLSLAVNQRATQALVDATNALYAHAGDAFAMPDDAIRYVPVGAAGRADREPLHSGGMTIAQPLLLHRLDDDSDAAALAACVAQIAAYLEPGRWRIGDRALEPGDIAVLLPRHDDIAALRQRLQALRIPCVGAGRSDLFATPWATELRVLLHALMAPGDVGAVRAALATRLLGCDYAQLRALDHDSPGWRAQADGLALWAEAWQRHGVLHAVDRVIADAAPRLLARVDGERALTDLRHLGELLQAESQRCSGAQQLLAWFATRCAATAQGDDAAARERELRIESDQRRVQLLTLHASKGLEFPIVLLPLMGRQRGRRETYPVWTERRDGQRRIDLGSGDLAAHQQTAAREDLQERLRVLYVALTRAEHACHLFLGPLDATPDDHASALDHLLRGVDLAALAGKCPQIGLIDAAPTPSLAAFTTAPETIVRRARAWPARRGIDAAYSFSSLMSRAQLALRDDDAARDEAATKGIESALAEVDAVQADERLLRLSPWRGTEFGNGLHALFEHRDLAQPMAAQRDRVRAELQQAGLRVEPARRDDMIDAVIERVQSTLDTDLGDGLRLGALSAAMQRAEMGFQFRLEHLDLQRLQQLCDARGEPGLIPHGLGDTRLRGFLSGKIDLVFVHGGAVHVLDYKSNHLGNALADYCGAALDAAMDAHGYRWQALLYAIAVRRYLARRQRQVAAPLRLGDTLYLFLRAVGLAPGAGVWRHRFDDDFLAAVDALFAASEVA